MASITRDASGRETRMTVKRGSTVLSDLGYSYTKPGTSGAAGDRVNVQTSTDHAGAGTLVPAGSVTTYGYDSLDRVTSVVEKTSTGSASASWTYAYDKAGNRTSHTRAGATGVGNGTTTYGYNAAHQLTPSGKASAYTRPSGTGYYLHDRLGSVIAITDESGALVTTYRYDPYGNIRTAPGQDTDLAWNNRLLYAGAPLDTATGLYRHGIRWYDPNTGRYTQPDPTTQETNPYTYAAAKPVNALDPFGAASSWKAKILGSVAGIAGGVIGYGMGSVAGPTGGAVGAYVGARFTQGVVEEAADNPKGGPGNLFDAGLKNLAP